MSRRFVLLLALVLVASSAFADTLLIPLNYNGPGAYGAKWHTSVTISSRTVTVWVSGPGLLFNSCPKVPDGCTDPYLLPGNTAKLSSEAPRGIFINVPGDGGNVFASAHIAAEPRNPDTEGTEIPIARSSSFVKSLSLINVPTGATSTHPLRSLLRIYAPLGRSIPGPTPSATAYVTAYDVDNPTVPKAVIKVTMVSQLNGEPAYAELDLSRFASVAPFVNLDLDAGEPGPMAPGQICCPDDVKVWGFVTVTDNATNDVITITAR